MTTPDKISDIDALRLMVRGAYDLQALRMQTGLRLCANFRSRLTDQPSAEGEQDEEMSEDAKKVIEHLKESYRRLTDGVAKNRTLPDEKRFTGDHLISTFSELTLVDQYIRLEKQENLQFSQMNSTLEKIPIYIEWLSKQVGVGPAMAGVIITYFDPAKARHVSSFWKYAGLDLGPDGVGRSRRQEHLVDRAYINKSGQEAVRKSVTYEPFLKTKLVGVLGPSFLRSGSGRRRAYDDYKHRLESDPARIKVKVEEWKKRRAAGEDVSKLWTPGRIHAASIRYMVKMFLLDLWKAWRTLEGLPVTPSYHEAKLGHVHGADKAA